MAESSILTVRLEPEPEPEVEARLTAAARELRRSPGEPAGEAIAAWLDLQAWQVREIEAALAEAEVAAAFRRWGA